MPTPATLAKPPSAPIAKLMSTPMSATTPAPRSTEGPVRFSRRSFVEVAAFGVTALSLGTVLCSCTGAIPSGAGTSRASDEVVIAINTGSEPEAGFDPFYSWGCGEHVHEPLIQSTLITTDENLDFVNDLAEQYACSDDRLSWTFLIRDDVKFSDGTILTAHAFRLVHQYRHRPFGGVCVRCHRACPRKCRRSLRAQGRYGGDVVGGSHDERAPHRVADPYLLCVG